MNNNSNVTTISTCNGSTVSLGHNMRVKEIVERENEKWQQHHPGEYRINPDGEFEIWKHESLQDAYNKLFGKAIADYNQKQIKHGTPDRCIDNYLNHIRKKEGTDIKAKHAIYEMIFSVGSKDAPIIESISKNILKEMSDEFIRQNPHLYVTGIYYHNDETGVPHIHLDYIPWCDDLKRGPSIQNGMKSALRQQGIVGENSHNTAQMKWERKMNDLLESICNKYGYEVNHYQRGQNVEHKTVEKYRIDKEIETKKQELAQLFNLPAGKIVTTKAYVKQLEEIANQYARDKSLIDQAKRDILAAVKEFTAYSNALEKLEQREASFDNEVNSAANKKVVEMESSALDFINANGLNEAFSVYKQQIVSVLKKSAEQQKQKR